MSGGVVAIGADSEGGPQPFESMAQAVVMLHVERRIIDLNPAAERYFPGSSDSLTSESAAEVSPLLADAVNGIDGHADTTGSDLRTDAVLWRIVTDAIPTFGSR